MYALKNGTSLASNMKHRYDESHFSLDLLFRSAFDYNRWKTSEIVLGVFGLFVIISMLFNGYSFYFVTLAFIIYATSYIIWKYRSTKHTFLSLFTRIPTMFEIKKAISTMACSCVGFGIILLPLVITWIGSSSKSLHKNLETVRDHSHLYPICSTDYGTLTISDLAYLSALAYHGTTEKSIKMGLDTYFEKHTLILDEDGSAYNDDETNLVYIAGQLEREPIFYHLQDTTTDSHYIVIRGSSSLKDFIEDLQLYSEIGV